MKVKPRRFYEFGPFRLDAAGRRLLLGGEEVKLGAGADERGERLPPKALDLLLFLVGRAGETFGRQEILDEVWRDASVEPGRVDDNVYTVRKFLGDRPRNSTYIETVPKGGYRFIADVREIEEEGGPELLLAERMRASFVVEEEAAEALSRVDAPAAAGPAGRPALAAAWRRPRAAALAACVVALLAMSGAAYLYFKRGETSGGASGQEFRSLAVLPLRQLGAAGAGDEYLGQGLADALITRLSNVRQLAVRPTSAVLKYGGATRPDLSAVAREQQVDAVLDGSFQRAGERLRVTVQLVSASDGAPLWADTFDATFTDIFAVQDEISRRVAESLAPRLTGEERARLARRPTEDTEAHRLYLTGRYFWNKRTKDDLLRAADYFRRALDSDPSYALAHAGLADAYYVLGYRRELPQPEAYASAKREAERALELDDGLAEAHTSLARLKGVYERDAAGSEREFRTAIGLNPNYPTARHWYSRLLLQLGRVEEAAAEASRAYQLDPLSLIINNNLGELLYYARRYDESLAHLRKTRELDPSFNRVSVAVFFYFNYLRKGMYEEACREFADTLPLGAAERERFAAELLDAYRAGGERAIWRKQIELLPKVAAGDQHFAVHMAEAYAWLGEKERVFEWLNRAADERHPGVMFLRTDPDFEAFRDDPRFEELVRRVEAL